MVAELSGQVLLLGLSPSEKATLTPSTPGCFPPWLQTTWNVECTQQEYLATGRQTEKGNIREMFKGNFIQAENSNLNKRHLF